MRIAEDERRNMQAGGRLTRDVLLQVLIPCQHLLPKLLQNFGRVVVHTRSKSQQPAESAATARTPLKTFAERSLRQEPRGSQRLPGTERLRPRLP